MNNDWQTRYVEAFAKWNGYAITLERQKDANGKFWGRYSMVRVSDGVSIGTVNYSKAKHVLSLHTLHDKVLSHISE